MQIDLSPLAVVLYVSGTITFLLSLFVLITYGRKNLSFFTLLLGVSIWEVTYGIALTWFEPSGRLFWGQAQYIGIGITMVGLFTYGLAFTGKGRFLTPLNIALFAILPILTTSALWSHTYRSLVWSEVRFIPQYGLSLASFGRGPLFWVFAVQNYLMLAGLLGLLLVQAYRSTGIARSQSTLAIISLLVSFLSNFLNLSGLGNPIPGLDLTPFGFVFSTVLFSFSIIRYTTLDRLGVPRNQAVENLPDAFFVLDQNSRVTDVNPAGLRLLDRAANQVIGKRLQDIRSYKLDLLEPRDDRQEQHRQIRVESSRGPFFFDVDIIPLNNWRGQYVGRTVTLHNTTELMLGEEALRDAKEQVDQLNQRLMAQMEQLKAAQKELLEQQKQMTMLDEREKMGRQLQDGVGQVLSSLNIVLQTVQYQLANNQTQQVMDTLAKFSRVISVEYDDLKAYILGLHPLPTAGPFGDAVQALVKHHMGLGSFSARVEYPASLPAHPLDASGETALLDILREALTNIREHAPNANVQVVFATLANPATPGQMLRMEIRDDGPGFEVEEALANTQRKGQYGLLTMQQRATGLGGELQISSQPGKGTTLVALVPLSQA